MAASTRFFQIQSNLDLDDDGHFALEASICSDRKPLTGATDQWYRVRILIPPDFPYVAAEFVPLDPKIRWQPHQNGDWECLTNDGSWTAYARANILCPPPLYRVRFEELLLPYIRNAHRWITDALAGTLIHEEDPYELPHTINVSGSPEKIYVANTGEDALTWLRMAKFGQVRLARRQKMKGAVPLLVLRELVKHGPDNAESLESNLTAAAFGQEDQAGWAPWVFAACPVVEKPHRPLVRWEDLSSTLEKRVLDAIRQVGGDKPVPVLLLAFEVPETWGGSCNRVAWGAIDLAAYSKDAFRVTPKGFRKIFPFRLWPRVRNFISKNERLRWRGWCTDVSPEALLSRAGPLPDVGAASGIAILGTGAVGSILAKALSKQDSGRLVLIDKETLEPGNLVRHEGLRQQVGALKAASVAELLSPIHASRSIQSLSVNIVEDWKKVVEAVAECDFILDATADSAVNALTSVRRELSEKCFGWCYVTPGPQFGVLVLRRVSSSLTLEEAESSLAQSLPTGVRKRFEESANESDLIMPEPGCYTPTFPAPYHLLSMMVHGFMTTILDWRSSDQEADLVTLFGLEEHPGVIGRDLRVIKQIKLQ